MGAYWYSSGHILPKPSEFYDPKSVAKSSGSVRVIRLPLFIWISCCDGDTFLFMPYFFPSALTSTATRLN